MTYPTIAFLTSLIGDVGAYGNRMGVGFQVVCKIKEEHQCDPGATQIRLCRAVSILHAGACGDAKQ